MGFINWYRENGLNPLGTALALGGMTGGLVYAGIKPLVETGKSIARPFAGKGMFSEQDLEAAGEEVKNKYRTRLAYIAGGLGTLVSAAALYNKEKMGPLGGLLSWRTPYKVRENISHTMKKTGSVDYDSVMDNGVTANIDWSRPISLATANDLMLGDPYLQRDPYVVNLGTAIVNNAALSQHTNKPTLGGVFDSAVDKIGKKLNFEGVLSVGANAVLANTAARAFTGALGLVCDLSPRTRNALVDAGTWAGAIKSILN